MRPMRLSQMPNPSGASGRSLPRTAARPVQLARLHILGDFEVVAHLEIHPEDRRIFEIPRQPERRVDGDTAPLVHDVRDPCQRQIDFCAKVGLVSLFMIARRTLGADIRKPDKPQGLRMQKKKSRWNGEIALGGMGIFI